MTFSLALLLWFLKVPTISFLENFYNLGDYRLTAVPWKVDVLRKKYQPKGLYATSNVAKRVDTLSVIGYILDTHHFIAPLINVERNSQMTFNQANLNIGRGEGASQSVLHCSLPFKSELFAKNTCRKNVEGISTFLQLLLAA